MALRHAGRQAGGCARKMAAPALSCLQEAIRVHAIHVRVDLGAMPACQPSMHMGKNLTRDGRRARHVRGNQDDSSQVRQQEKH